MFERKAEEMEPYVSVVIPVYNAEPYLKRTLNSILRQKPEAFEVICVDDGSTDRSLQILREFESACSNVHVYTQKNQTAGAARNEGLRHVRGQYIYFADSDDVLACHAIEWMIRRGRETEADVLVSEGMVWYPEDGVVRPGNYLDQQVIAQIGKEVFSKHDLPEEILSFARPFIGNKVFRRSLIEEHHLVFQPLANANDVYFVMMAMLKAERIAVIPEPLFFYRNGHISTSRSRSVSPLCCLEAYMSGRQTISERETFEPYERGWVNNLLGSMSLDLFTSRLTADAKCKLMDALFGAEKVQNLGLLRHPAAYYSDLKAYRKLEKMERLGYPVYRRLPHLFHFFFQLYGSAYGRYAELARKHEKVKTEPWPDEEGLQECVDVLLILRKEQRVSETCYQGIRLQTHPVRKVLAGVENATHCNSASDQSDVQYVERAMLPDELAVMATAGEGYVAMISEDIRLEPDAIQTMLEICLRRDIPAVFCCEEAETGENEKVCSEEQFLHICRKRQKLPDFGLIHVRMLFWMQQLYLKDDWTSENLMECNSLIGLTSQKLFVRVSEADRGDCSR